MNAYNAYTTLRLTFDLVFEAFEEKGYFLAKVGKGYHCQTTDEKLPNLQSAMSYLESLPNRRELSAQEIPIQELITPEPEESDSKSVSTSPDIINTFDVVAFTNGLDIELQSKFTELTKTELSLTDAVLTLIEYLKQRAVTLLETQREKKTVTEEVAAIVEVIMIYNQEQKLGMNRLVPTYNLINRISQQVYGKTVAKKTVDLWLKDNAESLHPQLEDLGIPGGLYNSLWNGRNHRKTMPKIIEAVVAIFERAVVDKYAEFI